MLINIFTYCFQVLPTNINLLNGSVLYSPFRKQWDRSFTEVIAYSATMHVLPIIFAHNFSSVGSNENGMVAMVTIT